MKKNILDEELMIVNPIRCARSEKKYKIGQTGYFNCAGWDVEARVTEIVYDIELVKSKVYIYRITDIDYTKYNGLELSDKELMIKEKIELRGGVYVERV